MKLKSTKDATDKQVERILKDIERARDIKREVKKKGKERRKWVLIIKKRAIAQSTTQIRKTTIIEINNRKPENDCNHLKGMYKISDLKCIRKIK